MYDLLNRRQIVNMNRQVGESIKMSNKEVVVTEKETIFKLIQKGRNAKMPKTSADAPVSSHTIFQIVSVTFY